MVWQKIGVVGVDSGQILICDPCYIDSEWEIEECVHKYKVTLENGSEEIIEHCSDRWFELIDKINSGDVKLEQIMESKSNFSYNACCQKDLFKQLNYKIGHEGVGVALSTGFGDGLYEVWANKKRIVLDGVDMGVRITEIKMKFITDRESKIMKKLIKR